VNGENIMTEENSFKLTMNYTRMRQYLLRCGIDNHGVILYNSNLEHVTLLFELEFNCYVYYESVQAKDGTEYMQMFVRFREQSDYETYMKEFP